jgi:hypothetical protein
MSQLPRVAPVMTAGWPDVVDELDRWRDAERVATLWWRDDDAVAPSARLDRLVTIAGKVPVALAVIPALPLSTIGRGTEPGCSSAWLASFESLGRREKE